MLFGRVICVAFAIVFIQCGTPGDSTDPPEMREYVARIRESKMSESAHSVLAGIAGIRLGQTKLSFLRDDESGAYFTSFQSMMCPRPDADTALLRAANEETSRLRDVDITKMRPLADMDSSGFVTTEEANEFRSLFEFGLQLRTVTQNEGGDTVRICKGVRLSLDKLRDKKHRFSRLVEQARRLGIEGITDSSFQRGL